MPILTMNPFSDKEMPRSKRLTKRPNKPHTPQNRHQHSLSRGGEFVNFDHEKRLLHHYNHVMSLLVLYLVTKLLYDPYTSIHEVALWSLYMYFYTRSCSMITLLLYTKTPDPWVVIFSQKFGRRLLYTMYNKFAIKMFRSRDDVIWLHLFLELWHQGKGLHK